MPDVMANGARFHYELDDFTDPWKPAETVIIQHGFGRSGRQWYGWVPRLADEYRVIRRDMRGHGDSEDPGPGFAWSPDLLAEDFKAFIDELGIESFHYVGESVGAMLGVVMSTRWPERFKSVTLCSMAMTMRKADYDAGKFSTEGGMDWNTALGTLGVGGWAESQMVPGVFAGMDGPVERREWIVKMWDRTPRHVAQELQRAVMDFDVTDLLPQITVPTLVLAPSRSTVQPLSRQVKIYEAVPNARISVIDGPGHEVYLDSTAAAAAAVKRFIASVG